MCSWLLCQVLLVLIYSLILNRDISLVTFSRVCVMLVNKLYILFVLRGLYAWNSKGHAETKASLFVIFYLLHAASFDEQSSTCGTLLYSLHTVHSPCVYAFNSWVSHCQELTTMKICKIEVVKLMWPEFVWPTCYNTLNQQFSHSVYLLSPCYVAFLQGVIK